MPTATQHLKTVLVLGGAGFVGRHVVAALQRRGHQVIIGSRHPARPDRRLDALPNTPIRRAIRLERRLQATDWLHDLEDADAVINCVGILRPRLRETYDRVHHLAPAALAAACRARDLRLIHVSALGLRSDARSRFLTSKKRGENALLSSGADAYVVRPSLLIGDGGFGARWLQRVANWPLHPVPQSARGRISALRVEELGDCLATLALAPDDHPALIRRCIELGGPSLTSMAQLLQALRQRAGPAPQMPIPAVVARTAAHVCDLLHITPYSYGHFELLLRDNAPAVNHAALVLGHAPTHVATWNSGSNPRLLTAKNV
ncbi:MAG: NAD(P)H-binding protein [Gammaproteobacteria bacterium]